MRAFLAFAACWLALMNTGHAQEALRASIAGQQAAEAQRKSLSGGGYNVQWKDARFRFSTALQLEWMDNVRLQDQNASADFIIQPSANVFAFWPLTEKNALNFSIGVGYRKYIENPDLDGVTVAPGSQIAFNLYVNDFVFNFHDGFSYSQDVVSQPTVTGVGKLSSFENVAGVSATWDQNKAIFTVGYDHSTYVPMESAFDYLQRNSELFIGRAGFLVNPLLQVGAEFGGGLTDYAQDTYGDSSHWSAGAFIDVRSSEYLTLRASAGFTTYYFDPSVNSTNTGSLISTNGGTASGFYLDLGMQHRVNSSFSYSLSLGRSFQIGTSAENIQLYYGRVSMGWKLFQKTTLGASLFYEHGTESSGAGETFDRYGGGIGFGRPITKKLSASFNYDYSKRTSDIANRIYSENRLALNLTYIF